MKKLGDVVVYVVGASEHNALVVGSRTVGEVEQLDLIYLDPDVAQLQMMTHGTASKAFGILPMEEGNASGWWDAIVTHEGSDGPLPESVMEAFDRAMADIRADARKQIDELQTTNTALNETVAQLKAQVESTPPATETKHYADGSSATGPAPLPDHSPEGAPEVPAPTEQVQQ